MPHGYSQYTIQANKSADRRLVGVALGRACIANNVSVAEVAKRFKVSRQTVYNWFDGKHLPNDEMIRAITLYIGRLTK